MTLLQEMNAERARRNESLRLETQAQLRVALQEVIPAESAVVFGSLIKPGKFGEMSDIEVAFEREPPGISVYQLTSLLAERLGRRVDVILLPECRFREKIAQEGERWTPRD
ncbi:hypothetical protein BH20VER1_BH20VER1_32190 [soil metagenome]